MSTSVLKRCLNLEESIHKEKDDEKSEKKKRNRKNKNKFGLLTDKGQKIRKVDYFEENVKSLTEQSSTSFNVNKILEYNQGRLLKNRPKIRKEKKKKDEPTVFTEEDFIKFEQSYFVKGKA